MTITFRPAVRESVGLIIGLVGPSGGGKTFTALRLAKGISGDKSFAVIDTEAGRAKHYADQFHFDHADLKAPFRPDGYLEAIMAADAASYPVIVVDSFSHEHAGEGGLLDWHEEEYQRLGGRDQVKMTAWIKPKMAHRKMVQRLLQVRAHLILCFRAEEKIEMIKGKDGKMEIRAKTTLAGFSGWVPICEKNLPYELTASFMLMPDKPGYPQPIKLEAQHRPLFPLDQLITEESGRRLAEWAKGGIHAETDQGSMVRSDGNHQGAGNNVSTEDRTRGATSEKPAPMGVAEVTDRAVLKGKITAAADKLRMPTAIRATLAKNLLGGGTIDTADIGAVQDLLEAVRAWTPQKETL